MLTTKRKSVEKLDTKKVKWGSATLLRITYVDGRVSYGVSVPGMLALFGRGEAAARSYFQDYDL
jgi:hypothetical protein